MRRLLWPFYFIYIIHHKGRLGKFSTILGWTKKNGMDLLALCWRSPYFVNIFAQGCQSKATPPVNCPIAKDHTQIFLCSTHNYFIYNVSSDVNIIVIMPSFVGFPVYTVMEFLLFIQIYVQGIRLFLPASGCVWPRECGCGLIVMWTSVEA